ncbi:hypothetical protein BH10BAC5_BH10BAC5_09250 [soil metagenome]
MKKILFFLLLISTPLFSQWSTDPNVNNLVSGGIGNQSGVSICTDGAGGMIMTWFHNRPSGDQKIYAQKFNVFGQPVWNAGGIEVCTFSSNQFAPIICSDASGGAIIYWVDFRGGGPGSGAFDLYAQRVRTDGVLMWNTNGIKVNNLSFTSVFLRCLPAEAGSSIICWYNSVFADYGIYSQKLDAFGNRTWDLNDVRIPNYDSYDFNVCSDGGKGIYICWTRLDGTHSFDIHAQHINALGSLQWSPYKVVCDEEGIQEQPSICEDQAGGFIVAWEDLRSYFYQPATVSLDIYAAHFNSNGDNLWTTNGIPVCTESHDQNKTVCISDLHGGAHIFWLDFRNFAVSGFRVYGQNLTFNGNSRWNVNGNLAADNVDYFPTNNFYHEPKVTCVDPKGGIICSWLGYYDMAHTQYGILTQKMNYNGVIQWDPNGVFASTGNLKHAPLLISDGGSGGCNLAWADARGGTVLGDFDIYAQHIKSNSSLGNYKPKPVPGVSDILSQNFPNPFNPTTNIAFTLANDANVSITVFDMSGRELEVLVDGLVTAGDHSVTWNANKYASGTYFYKFTNGNNVEVKKMFLVK